MLFNVGPAQSSILTDREVVSLFLHFTVNPKPRVDFIDRPRCCLRGKECSITRFAQVESRWGYSGTSDRIRWETMLKLIAYLPTWNKHRFCIALVNKWSKLIDFKCTTFLVFLILIFLLRFSVNRRIFVVGFGLYGSIHGPTDYQVNIQVCFLLSAGEISPLVQSKNTFWIRSILLVGWGELTYCLIFVCNCFFLPFR